MNLFYESVFAIDEETHDEYLKRVSKRNPGLANERIKERTNRRIKKMVDIDDPDEYVKAHENNKRARKADDAAFTRRWKRERNS